MNKCISKISLQLIIKDKSYSSCNKIGVYCVLNIIDNKKYIGSSWYVGVRLWEHYNDLIKNKHYNCRLQRAFNKHEEENFEFHLLEICNKDELLNREQYYMDLFESYNKIYGYNICPTANRTVISEETREKLKQANGGENNGFYNKKHTKETKKRFSKLRKGKKKGKENPNYGNRGSKNPLFGKKHPKEWLVNRGVTSRKSILVRKDGETRGFESQASFARYIKVRPSYISTSIMRGKTCKGYKIIQL